MPLLVGERPGASIGEEQRVEQPGKLECEMTLEPRPGEVARVECGLDGVALKADVERPCLGEGAERPHPDVGRFSDVAGAGQLDVPASGAMARLAIHRQGRVAGEILLRGAVELQQDLTAVALLAALKPLVTAEHPCRRPVAAVGDRDRRRNGNEAAVGAAIRIADPAAVGA
jgi:hypothetical protein